MGRWIAIEGVDGSGKTSQVPRLAARLRAAGVEVVTTREPGGTPFGAVIRELVLSPEGKTLSPRARLLFFEADRLATVRDVVEPNLSGGRWVLSDRGPFGSSVYQGHLDGIPIEEVERLTMMATRGKWPDLVIILDLPVEESSRRLRARPDGVNWLDAMGPGYRQGVRDAYHKVAAAHEERAVSLSAEGTVEEVEARVWNAVKARLLS